MGDAFSGFGPGTVGFLGDLVANNDRDWMQANDARYREDWLAPARAFVVSAGEALRDIAPEVRAEPKINGSIFRINRDTRFSADKSPYKGHLDIWFWEGVERSRAVTGFYLRVLPDRVGIGAGAVHFDPSLVGRYRDLVVDPTAGPALAASVSSVERAGFEVTPPQWKRTPKGHEEPEDPLLARLLRNGGLFAAAEVEHPASMGQARFVSWCMTRWTKQAPVHAWLRDHLQQGPGL